MGLFKAFLVNVGASLREMNSDKWSLTKVGILFFLYPAITVVFMFDAFKNGRMEWLNASVFATAIVAPRAISQIIIARFTGSVAKDEPKKEEPKKAASPDEESQG
jgi:hypothetical protein